MKLRVEYDDVKKYVFVYLDDKQIKVLNPFNADDPEKIFTLLDSLNESVKKLNDEQITKLDITNIMKNNTTQTVYKIIAILAFCMALAALTL